MSRGIDRTTLLEELVGMLEHKKTREAQRAFHCHGCGDGKSEMRIPEYRLVDKRILDGALTL